MSDVVELQVFIDIVVSSAGVHVKADILAVAALPPHLLLTLCIAQGLEVNLLLGRSWERNDTMRKAVDLLGPLAAAGAIGRSQP